MLHGTALAVLLLGFPSLRAARWGVAEWTLTGFVAGRKIAFPSRIVHADVASAELKSEQMSATWPKPAPRHIPS